MYSPLISLLKKKTLLPVIIFTFSKKKCEEYAGALSNVDLTTGSSEKSMIHVFIEKSLGCLKGLHFYPGLYMSGTDRELPQIQRMRDILSRGIAVHHGGLLPIMKEIVEILFTRGLVKVLFATETFAMGAFQTDSRLIFRCERSCQIRRFFWYSKA
jgi:antiviral helicase SKI2